MRKRDEAAIARKKTAAKRRFDGTPQGKIGPIVSEDAFEKASMKLGKGPLITRRSNDHGLATAAKGAEVSRGVDAFCPTR